MLLLFSELKSQQFAGKIRCSHKPNQIKCIERRQDTHAYRHLWATYCTHSTARVAPHTDTVTDTTTCESRSNAGVLPRAHCSLNVGHGHDEVAREPRGVSAPRGCWVPAAARHTAQRYGYAFSHERARERERERETARVSVAGARAHGRVHGRIRARERNAAEAPLDGRRRRRRRGNAYPCGRRRTERGQRAPPRRARALAVQRRCAARRARERAAATAVVDDHRRARV